jgi:hypothetical protein
MQAMCGTRLSLVEEVPVCIRRLKQGQLAQAFPLLREAGRCESSQAWIDYASEFVREDEDKSWPIGIMVAEQASRCIVGLFSFLVRPCLRFGRVLSVGDLTVMAPFGREEITVRLLDSVAEIGRRYQVRETEIELGKAAAWCVAILGKQGYNLDDRRQIVWRRGGNGARGKANP